MRFCCQLANPNTIYFSGEHLWPRWVIDGWGIKTRTVNTALFLEGGKLAHTMDFESPVDEAR